MGGLDPGLGRVIGESWTIRRTHVGFRLVWGTFGRCSHTMTGGLEMCVLDDTNTRSFIRPGHESSVRSAQFIPRWELIRESDTGTAHW
jgi:hypothetical protein